MNPPLTDADRAMLRTLEDAGPDGIAIRESCTANLVLLAYLAHWGLAKTKIRKHGPLCYVHERHLRRAG